MLIFVFDIDIVLIARDRRKNKTLLAFKGHIVK